MNGLTTYERDYLKAAMAVVQKKPDAAMRYLLRTKDPDLKRAFIAMALSSLLEVNKAKLAMMELNIEVAKMALNMDFTKETTQ